MNKINECPICKKVSIDVFINLPHFQHFNFKTISKNEFVSKCMSCGLVFNPDAIKRIKTFKTKKYYESRQTDQLFYVEEFHRRVSRSFLQAKIINDKIINNESIRILDIGCFDGKLLTELNKIFNNSEFVGFDINENFKSIISDKKKFHFETNNLNNIEGEFDLIILSHSIYYFPNLKKLMFSVGKLLKDGGYIFIQLTDIRKNLIYSLMGDQCYTFTKSSIINVLEHLGYSSEFINNNYFQREILIKAKMKNNYEVKTITENCFDNNIKKIEEIKNKLIKINFKNLSVLGTTANAAFVDEIMGEKIKYFVDENMLTNGGKFRGKNIYHPSHMKQNDNILIFLKNSISIKQRLSNLYKGKYIII